MATEGTLVFADQHEQEHRVTVTGSLDLFQERDGGTYIQGVLNVDEDHVDAVRDAMERQAEEPGARFTGEVTDGESNEDRPVVDVPMFILDVYDNGNVRLRSTAPEEDR
jgi:hypothetical protein